ncbi:hypothetical protein EC988_004174 [Linderina pennispora]|nr:hypothetical protein EC988_004174 [Linderina pennispora]
MADFDDSTMAWGESPSAAGDDDDFGGFGDFGQETGADNANTATDFDDFGDFDDFDSAPVSEPDPAQPPAVPSLAPTADPVLSAAQALFNGATGDSEQTDIVQQCLELAFGSTEAVEIDTHTGSTVTTAADAASIDSLERSLRKCAPGASESRLLRNLVWIALAANVPEEFKSDLLTPLSVLRAQARSDNQGAQELDPLTIEDIRLIATGTSDAQDEDIVRALQSIDQLIKARMGEVAKKKEEIDTYNQVIQTLVAQASKLH